jgi:DNA-3-methyladenine glycosylase II
MTGTPAALTDTTFAEAIDALAASDADLDGILARFGPPPMWAREPGFPTLIHIILEQQVSLASARAAFDRLQAVVTPLTPEGFLQLDDGTLRAVGFSRQKTSYVRHLAQSLLAGHINLNDVAQMGDSEARRCLLALKGIGPWTTDIYLLMALRRPDVWPAGDLALQIAMQQVKQLPARPTLEEMEALSLPWRPWRAVAARMLWHFYLSR